MVIALLATLEVPPDERDHERDARRDEQEHAGQKERNVVALSHVVHGSCETDENKTVIKTSL